MNCLTAQQCIDRHAEMVRKCLKLLDTYPPITLLNCNEGRARHANHLRGFVLPDFRAFASEAKAATYLLCGQLV
jgi:hypothetical protein